jgi:adenine-specific DNA-methyltransferase
MTNTKNTENEVKRTGLYWPGKRTEVERVALPFQVVETVNVSRATREEAPLFAAIQGDEAEGWRNKLIWGENKYIMASLLDQGFAGKINLIYIDPPFATGADFSVMMKVGDQEWTKEASLIEEKAYRDTWGKGLDSYLQMLYDRLVLMQELLEEYGTIWVHLDDRVGHYVKVLLDEVFGPEAYINEIIWHYPDNFQGNVNRYADNHNMILVYGNRRDVKLERVKIPLKKPVRRDKRVWDKELKKIVAARDEKEKIIYETYTERYADNVWTIGQSSVSKKRSAEYLGYPTQKPEEILRRVILSGTKSDDIVADFFCGSGTTGAVAEKLERRWVMADLSRFAIQTTRKRLLDIPDCRPFEILDLGKYERQYWRAHVNGQGAKEDEVLTHYLDFIVQLYRGERATGFAHLHGRKAGRMVHVGGVDAPVTLSEINEALDECAANRFRGLDVLGWEWEMGLHDLVTVEGRKRGVDLRLLTIPREVMDPRAVEAGDIEFYELAYLNVTLERRGSEAQVVLKNFIVPNEDLVPDEVREKIKRWSDYVDFWAVDWDFQGDTFHNQWQSYRTRQHPALRLDSDWHTYDRPGKYQVMVKVIDIFGNDTTRLLQVDAK